MGAHRRNDGGARRIAAAAVPTLGCPPATTATHGRVVIDGRNHVDGDAARSAGFVYEGIGR